MTNKVKAVPAPVGIATPSYGCCSDIGNVAEHLFNELTEHAISAGTLGATNVRGYSQPTPAPEDYASVISLHDPSTWRLDAVKRLFGIIVGAHASPKEAWLDSMRLAQKIYAPSPWSVESIGGKTELLRFGVDSYFSYEPKKRQDKFRALVFAEDLADRRKGLELAIDGFKKAFEGREDVELLVHSIIPRDIDKDDARIRLSAGMMTPFQLADLYRCADVLIHPARAEAFGFTPLEAMACGTPAIHSAKTGMADFKDLGLVAMSQPVRGVDGEWHEVYPEEIAMLLQFASEEWTTVQAKAKADAASVKARFPWSFKPLISSL